MATFLDSDITSLCLPNPPSPHGVRQPLRILFFPLLLLLFLFSLLLQLRPIIRPSLVEYCERQADEFDTDDPKENTKVLAQSMFKIGPIYNDLVALKRNQHLVLA